MPGKITFDGDGPFELVAQSATAEAESDTIAFRFRVLEGGRPSQLTLRLRLATRQAHELWDSLGKAIAQRKSG